MATSVTPRAALLEEVELASLRGIAEAAAPELARRVGLRHEAVGGASALVAAEVDVPLFNRVLGLGVLGPAEPDALDRIFFLWVGPPPRSTLFPYTTLFR